MKLLPHELEALYRATAPVYEDQIAPVMRPLAKSLVQQASVNSAETVLDVGTGTGLAAFALYSQAKVVIGVDASLPMLRVATDLRKTRAAKNLHFLQMDANRLDGLREHAFDVVVSSFGLSECSPRSSLAAMARVLRSGGRLYLQEWGPVLDDNDPRYIFEDTLADFASTEASGLQSAFREYLAELRIWDQHMQDTEDYEDQLAAAGFDTIEATEDAPVRLTLQPGVEQFLDFALGWAPRRLEVEAMDEHTRIAFMEAVRARLKPLLDTSGALHWAPQLFRAKAGRKP